MRLMLFPYLLQPQQQNKPKHTQMKLKTTLIAALSLACTAISQAFVIDFDSFQVDPGGTFSANSITSGNPITVDVNGYGTVTFSIADGADPVSVDTNFSPNTTLDIAPDQTLEFYSGDVVTVTFAGLAPLKPKDGTIIGFEFGQAGDDSEGGADSLVSSKVNDNEYQLSLSGLQSGGAGLTYIEWNVVPEPSSAALGALGMSMILLRRRKA